MGEKIICQSAGQRDFHVGWAKVFEGEVSNITNEIFLESSKDVDVFALLISVRFIVSL